MTQQIKSKQRVSDHGEVFTRQEEVNAMLDLVKDETLRIESRFLEPACGDGNFLIEILKRKLALIKNKHIKKRPRKEIYRSQRAYEFDLVLVIGSIYGIELQQDNVIACRERLCKFCEESYRLLFPKTASDEVIGVIRFILNLNIVQGNALKMCYVDDHTQDIETKMLRFSQWEPVSLFNRRYCIQRKEFEYEQLVKNGNETRNAVPQRPYPICYFLEIQNAKPID